MVSSGVVSAVDSILSSKAATENGSCGPSFNFLLAADDCVVETENLMVFSKVVLSPFESFMMFEWSVFFSRTSSSCSLTGAPFAFHSFNLLPYLDKSALKNQQKSFLYY